MSKPAAAAAALLAALVVALPSPAFAAPVKIQTKTPAGGATVSGNIVWEVTASNGTPTRIDFLVDGAQRWTEYLSPYRFNGDAGNLDTRSLSNGSHTLAARAVAASGSVSTSSVTVTVSNGTTSSGLAVSTTTPVAGATLGGSVVWEAKMTAGTASQIDFLVDGAQKWTERLTPYRFNGDTGSLDTAALANGSHKLTVRALDSSGRSATSETTVTVSNATSPPSPPPSGQLNRTVYCLGDPNYGTSGWAYDGTSLGWIRQYPKSLPERVAFDSSVALLRDLGCNTIKAEIQPNDPDPNGGTDVQRAQTYSTDSLLSKYGGQPSLGVARGNSRWYAFAFSTNAGYKPQASANWPNYNYIFSWHNSGPGGPPNIVLAVATATQSGCGQPYTPVSPPKLVVELNGGDLNKHPYGGATCLRFFGPTFTPGARYTVQMGVKWADDGTGSFEVWINGQRLAAVNNVSTMWMGQSIYPVFENYRPGKAMIGNLITWTNTVYYAGLVAGPTLADVALPSS